MAQSNPSTALIALQVVMNAIATGDDPTVKSVLSTMSLDKVESETAESLLSRLLGTAEEYANPEMVPVLLQAFEPNFTDTYRLPIVNRILMSQRFDDSTLAFCLDQIPERSTQSMVVDFINGPDDPNIMVGLVRLFEFRHALEPQDLRRLYDQAILRGNETAIAFLSYWLQNGDDYAPIPAWVHRGSIDESADVPMSVDVPMSTYASIDASTATQILTDGMTSQGRDDEEMETARLDLAKLLVGAGPDEIMDRVGPVLLNQSRRDLGNDPALFERFGPANAIVETDLAESDRLCDRYGGCRMLCCIEFESFVQPDQDDIVYPADQYTSTDWFLRYCQECQRPIRRPPHAVRMPLEHGGWKGCYCSRSCLEDAMPRSNQIVVGLVERLFLDLDRIGIRDPLLQDDDDVEDLMVQDDDVDQD